MNSTTGQPITNGNGIIYEIDSGKGLYNSTTTYVHLGKARIITRPN